MYHQDKELQDFVVQVKKLPTPNSKVNRIVDFLKEKAVSAKHEDSLIVERVLAYNEIENDEALPSLSSK